MKASKILTIIAINFLCICSIIAQGTNFTLVIDAGHGGQDPGAIGQISKEKDINLSIALKFGEFVKDNFNDVKIVYTRKTDVFVTLQGRADIANANNANLFVSIHTNSATNSSAFGTETYTLGLHRTESNLQVAMRENSVMLLEDDYQTKYQGFDPKSVDSYIMFQIMQDKFMDRSIGFASDIQKEFRNFVSRSDRGVRQAGLWVLHRSACPSVLVEVGFISNRSEEKFLSGADGQRLMATAIYNAFVKFKRQHDNMSGKTTASTAKPIEQSTNNQPLPVNPKTDDAQVQNVVIQDNTDTQPSAQTSNQPIFKIQILASSTKLKNGDTELKGVKNVDFYFENKLYKYTVGSDSDYNKIKTLQKEIR
ncbi:MAG: N-acetylmuramoyl-L-alanine amidase, partial [Paludibacter sp.]|nr:N-acetylmuramoyl-L-alanine amidase [Paludibacter sp.]